MTIDEFNTQLCNKVNSYPSDWRMGQKIFNAIDELYGVARAVQFEDGIDCFYRDELIPEFIKCALNRLSIEYGQSK